MRRLPSLRGIQAFEAVARFGNLAGAADFLGITGSAVSHRIRGLEKELGVQLLQRSPRGLTLTDAGRRYRGGVETAFAGLAQATSDLLGADASRPLTISLTSEIGIRWLMPRFHRFRARHPDIDTAILSTYEVVDMQAGAADLALRYGDGRWEGVEAEPILEFAVSPVCTPAVKEEIAGLSPAEALARQTIIREDDKDWKLWREAAGIEGFKPSRQLQFLDYSMAVTAAVEGHGILLGYSGYLEKEIAAGLLTYPFDISVPTGKGYHLVYRRDRLADPRVRAFRDWVLSETAEPDPAGGV
ncbi:LysR family transcriptional regulator [Pelagibius litoralis]|uniref:LysR family transcriptional regulator n=1 Tax=Pelagibius litoralis TaxID=374515 RepID=A0A967EW30_9PROT|nr:LysR substrate-binding domain-containing protein [Pelagibius litoralis]NIA69109.1 LysR family transcriptional regulator [Pelagibius litoralis]